LGIPVVVNGFSVAVYPAKAEGFFNGVIVGDAGEAAVLAGVNEPDLSGRLIVFR
jgi:hypothetical protein